MKIVCKLKRQGGTKVDFGKVQYHFKPENPADPDSPHSCEVTNPEHAARFLTINEAYYRADDETMNEPEAPAVDPLAEELDAEFPLAGKNFLDSKAIDNKAVKLLAEKHLGFSTFSKDMLGRYAKQQELHDDLLAAYPKHSAVELLREVMQLVANAQAAEKAEALKDAEEDAPV